MPLIAPPVEQDGDRVALTVAGRRYRLPAAAAPVLDALARHRTLTVAELATEAATTPATTESVLRALTRTHLVTLSD